MRFNQNLLKLFLRHYKKNGVFFFNNFIKKNQIKIELIILLVLKRNNNEVSLLCEMMLLDEGEIQDGEGEEERENPEREKKERKTLGARVRCEIGNGEEEEESGSEGVVLLLRS